MPVRLRIGPKLMVALAGLLAATVMVSGVAVAGLGAVNARTQELYRHNVLTTQAIAELQARLDDAADPDVDQAGLERLERGWAEFKRLVESAWTRAARRRSRR